MPKPRGIGGGAVPDRLVVDLDGDGQAEVLSWPDNGLPELMSRAPVAWPLDGEALEDLRWYLENYLLAPFGVWEDRGPAVAGKLAGWGDEVFGSMFGSGPARDAYQRARDRGLEIVFRSADPGLLSLPWELMRDGGRPVALEAGGISRSLPVADRTGTLEVPGGRLRVLMVISRPGGTRDVGYQMVARPLLERLTAVRGQVDLTVLRPPTFDTLGLVAKQAADAGEPFHVVHFDGHGAMPSRAAGGGAVIQGRPGMVARHREGVLAFEKPGGGSDLVGASEVAAVLANGRVPVVVLNACQSGAMGKELEASVATALLGAGCAAVVAMAYSVYAVAAAEFMAAFYESLFAGDSAGQAVTAGRKRLSLQDRRPSPKGDMPLADWLVPVHYLRQEVRFPQAATTRPAAKPSLDAALDEIRAAPSEAGDAQDPLAAVGTFVGRDDQFYELEVAARLQRVVVLAGPGGTGKTELAKGFARWWRDTGGVDDKRLVLWHSFEPGVASFGLDGVITEIGLDVLGAGFGRLDPPQRLEAVKRHLGQYRALLVWDNFESVREMPDPTGATPPLEEAGCAALKGFLEWVRDQSVSTVIITSRAREDWLGQVRRIGVGGLNRAEAVQYVDYLLASFPAARRRRERRSFAGLRECQILCARVFSPSGSGCLSGTFISHYLEFYCPVYSPVSRNPAYPAPPGRILRVRISLAVPGHPLPDPARIAWRLSRLSLNIADGDHAVTHFRRLCLFIFQGAGGQRRGSGVQEAGVLLDGLVQPGCGDRQGEVQVGQAVPAGRVLRAGCLGLRLPGQGAGDRGRAGQQVSDLLSIERVERDRSCGRPVSRQRHPAPPVFTCGRRTVPATGPPSRSRPAPSPG